MSISVRFGLARRDDSARDGGRDISLQHSDRIETGDGDRRDGVPDGDRPREIKRHGPRSKTTKPRICLTDRRGAARLELQKINGLSGVRRQAFSPSGGCGRRAGRPGFERFSRKSPTRSGTGFRDADFRRRNVASSLTGEP